MGTGLMAKCQGCGNMLVKVGASWIRVVDEPTPGSSFCDGTEDKFHKPHDGPIYVPEFHHTVACEVEFRYERARPGDRQHIRAWWCITHNMWTYNHGKVSEITWPDGSATRV